MYALESGADYYTQLVMTSLGIETLLFLCKNELAKNPDLVIEVFDAEAYFQKWLSKTPKNSSSYREFIELGGRE